MSHLFEKEKIILAPGLNGSELLRSLAKYGKNTIGVRIMRGGELALTALAHTGITIEEHCLSPDEETAIVYSLLQETTGYFGKSTTYADAVQIAGGLKNLRSMVQASSIEEEGDQLKASFLSNAEFPEKNEALLELYNRYMEKCASENMTDEVGLMRKALKCALPEKMDVDFAVLEEYPLTRLEAALIDYLSEGRRKIQTLQDLLEIEQKDIHISSYTEAYGTINEAEHIIDEIYSDDSVQPDECLIACASPDEYAQLFYDMTCRYESMHVTFGTGIRITNSLPAQLLRNLADRDAGGGYHPSAMRRILRCDAFDRSALAKVFETENKELYFRLEDLAQMAGGLRLSFDAESNSAKIAAYRKVLEKAAAKAASKPESKEKRQAERNLVLIDWTEKLAGEMARGGSRSERMLNFFSKYAFCRNKDSFAGKLDIAARDHIITQLSTYADNTGDEDVLSITPDILSHMIMRESSAPGSIHISGIREALPVMRRRLFVCGLSSANFPGNPRENYLILDSDHEGFCPPPGGIIADSTSRGIVEQRKTTLNRILDLAAALGTRIDLSFSGFDAAELKESNPSSVLFEYFRDETGTDDMEDFSAALSKTGFFDANVSGSRLAARAILDGQELEIKEDPSDIYEDYDSEKLLKRNWSPSAIERFMSCPRRFYLQYIRNIQEVKEDDMTRLLDFAATGNLAHALLEDLAEAGPGTVSKEEFLQWADQAMRDYFCGRIPANKELAEREVRKFRELMADTYDWETELGRTTVSAEEEIQKKHPSGINLRGFPDRLEKTGDGKYVITDFKAKKKVEHVGNDPETCIQVLIYAWLCENELGKKIDHCEYRYLRHKKKITCNYDDQAQEFLNDILENLKKALVTGKFERTPGKDNENCKYCTYGDICDSSKWDIKNEKEAENE